MKESKPRGRPIAPPNWSIDTTIDYLREALDRSPADVPVGVGRAALHHLEKAKGQEAELYRLKAEEERWHEWYASYEPIWNAARERGIEIGMPFDSNEWHWNNGQRRGTAATPGEALIAALDDKAVIV